MEKIEIKSFFTDWHEVSREQAKEYIKFLLENITTMRGEKLIQYIEGNKIRGIRVNKLLGGEVNNEI